MTHLSDEKSALFLHVSDSQDAKKVASQDINFLALLLCGIKLDIVSTKVTVCLLSVCSLCQPSF